MSAFNNNNNNNIINNNNNDDIIDIEGNTYNLIKEIIEEHIDCDGNKIKVIQKFLVNEQYNKHKKNVVKAVKKYMETNRDKINEYYKEHKKNKYASDPEYREREKTKARERYQKLKLLKSTENI